VSLARQATGTAPVKPVEAYTHVGGSAARLDLAEDALDRLAHFRVGGLDRARVHSAFQKAGHGDLLGPGAARQCGARLLKTQRMPPLGSATLIALIIAGQMLAAITLDHFGAFGLTPHPVNLSRLFGAALLIAGVILIKD